MLVEWGGGGQGGRSPGDYGDFPKTTSSSDIMLSDKSIKYCKIPKISPGAYIFQSPFLRGLHSEGLIYEGKSAFTNQLG